VPSLPVADWAPATAAMHPANARLERSRLIDQHDGNVVPYRVAKPAFVADQNLLGFPVLQLAFAFRANQNLEQTWGQAHFVFPVAS
jgi:hypothetical protein